METDLPFLVSDIGGTNMRVAMAGPDGVEAGSIRRYRNASLAGLSEGLLTYLDETGARPRAVAIAVAGPVRGGEARLTNVDWAVSEADLRDRLDVSTAVVLNDLQAQGHALRHLGPDDLSEIVPAPAGSASATRLLVGVGTGFNVAPVYDTGTGLLVPPAEAGHPNLPIRDETELALARHLEATRGFASVEEVLSGRGLANLDQWLTGGARREGGEVVEAAAAGDPVAEHSVDVFSRFLGRVTGNLALEFLPYGGIYYTGGVARGVAPFLRANSFVGALRDKGRFGQLIAEFGLRIVLDDSAALRGLAALLADLDNQN